MIRAVALVLSSESYHALHLLQILLWSLYTYIKWSAPVRNEWYSASYNFRDNDIFECFIS